jgi:hypothetical protein
VTNITKIITKLKDTSLSCGLTKNKLSRAHEIENTTFVRVKTCMIQNDTDMVLLKIETTT